MYREAEEHMKEGFCPVSKFIIGGVSGLLGIMMILIAPPTEKQLYFYLFGSIFLVISLACIFKGRVRLFFGSIIGAVLVILSGWYLIYQTLYGDSMFSTRSDQSIFNAFLFTFFLASRD